MTPRRPKPRSTGWSVPGRVVLAASAAWLASAASGIGAQEAPDLHGTIAGVVHDATTGRPLADARAVLEPEGPCAGHETPSRETVTGGDGSYGFAEVPACDFVLTVSRLGYRALSLWIEMPPSWHMRRSLDLVVDPVELEPIDVRVTVPWPVWSAVAPRGRGDGGGPEASPLDEALGLPTLDARRLDRDAVRTLSRVGEPDVFRALQALPGVSSRGDYSAEIWTRGAPWGLTRILLDGLPIYDPLHVGGTAAAVAAQGVETVAMMPGVRPASMPDGAAGTVYLASRRAAAGRSVEASLSTAALGATFEDRWLDERIGLSVTARRSWWDVIDPARALPGGGEGPIDYSFVDASGRVDLRMGSTLVEAGGLREMDSLDGSIRELVASSEATWGNTLGWLAVEQRLGDRRIRATAGRTDFLTTTRPKPWSSFYDALGLPSLGILEVEIDHRVARLAAQGVEGDGLLSWHAGAEWVEETLTQTSADAWDRGAPGVDEPAVSRRARGWIEAAASPGPLDLTAGVSFEHANGEEAPTLDPTTALGIRWRPVDRVVLEATRGNTRQLLYPIAPAGRAFGPGLGIGQVWVAAGAGVPALRADHATVSAQADVGAGLLLAATLWRRDLSGLWMGGVSTLDTDGSVVPVAAAGEAGGERGRGFELVLRRTRGRLTGLVGYTGARARYQAPDGTTWASPADRRNSVESALTLAAADGLHVGVAFRSETGWPVVVGPWTCSDGRGRDPAPKLGCSIDFERQPDRSRFERAPRYSSLDLSLAWEWRVKATEWGLTAHLRNVLGRDNAEAWRVDACYGAEVISVVCENPIGDGRFAAGLTAPTPAFAVRVRF